MAAAPSVPVSFTVALPRPARWLPPVLLLILGAYALFFHGLAERDLTSSHEARAAQNAQMMLQTGEWGLPRLFDKQIDLQKPPLYYWLVALVAKIQGGIVDAGAVRLPAAVSALGTALLLILLGQRLGRPRMGWIAALLLASFWHFTWMARVGRIDMPLTLTVTAALVGLWLARHEPERRTRWLILAYGAVGFGILFKGPIAGVLPGLVAVAWLLAERKHSPPAATTERRLGLWWGVPLVFAIAAPWFVWANHVTDGQLFRVFFLYHNVERGLGGDGALATHPWWFYGFRLSVDLLPWNGMLPIALWMWWRDREWRRDRLMLFAALWLFVMLGFLSLMRFKRSDYLLPAYPGAALFLGCAAERWIHRCGRGVAWGIGVVFFACIAGWLLMARVVLPDQDAARPYRAFANEIRRHTRDRVIFFRIESHPLAFHVGRPLHTVLEWENLDAWAGTEKPVHIVIDAALLVDAPNHLTRGRLELVARYRDFLPTHMLPRQRDDSLVLARTQSYASARAAN